MRTFSHTLKRAQDTAARPELAFKEFAKLGIFSYNPDIGIRLGDDVCS